MGISLVVIAESILVAKGVVTTIQHTDSRGHNLLGSDAGHQRHIEFPVETLRCEDGLDRLAQASKITLFLLLLRRERRIVWEIFQCPDNDAGHEDDATHLLQILLTLLPCMTSDGLTRRPTVGW